jgi:hypothetical protein
MAVDERNRLQLAEAAKRLLGADEGITLMELLPPVGWADVATRHDLATLETRIDARFNVFDQKLDGLEHKVEATLHRELRSQTWKLFALNATVLSAMLGAVVGLTRF